jgi:hypothetical protein
MLVVLCGGYSPEFLVECAVWSQLELPMDRNDSNMADRLIDRRLFHWSLGIIPPCHRYPVKKTFVDLAGLCNWPWSTKMVSDAMGNDIYWTQSSLG